MHASPDLPRRVRSTGWMLLVLTTAILVGACGSSQSTTTSRSNVLPLTQRLVGPLLFPGFHGLQLAQAIRDPRVWEASSGLAGAPLSQAAQRLERQGFVAGVRERLASGRASAAQVVSRVEQFRSAPGAAAELAYRRAHPQGWTIPPGVARHSFAVPGVPGSFGVAAAGPSGRRQAVGFAAGPFYYQVDVITPYGGGPGPSRGQLINACQALYRRVRGAPSA